MNAQSATRPKFLVMMVARFFSKAEEEFFTKVLPQVIRQAKDIEGFVSVDFWRNVADPNVLQEASYWESKEAAMKWRDNEFHKHLQKLGYSRLIMENTTTHWHQEGGTLIFQKCPVCGTAKSETRDYSETSFVTQHPDLCQECGYAFDVTPDLID